MSWTAEFDRRAFLEQPAGYQAPRGASLDSAVLKRELESLSQLFVLDLGARHRLWHPDQDRFYGIRYGHRHICSCDRGIMPQWPEWTTEEDLVEVTLDYAMLHDDLPVVSFIGPKAPDLRQPQMAAVMRPTLKEVKKIGWAEVVWRLMKAKIPGLDVPWAVHNLRVPMDWYTQMPKSPLVWSFDLAAQKGWV